MQPLFLSYTIAVNYLFTAQYLLVSATVRKYLLSR